MARLADAETGGLSEGEQAPYNAVRRERTPLAVRLRPVLFFDEAEKAATVDGVRVRPGRRLCNPRTSKRTPTGGAVALPRGQHTTFRGRGGGFPTGVVARKARASRRFHTRGLEQPRVLESVVRRRYCCASKV